MEEEKKSMKKKKIRYFDIYISKLLKNISQDHGITSNAKQQLNSVICLIARFLSSKAVELLIVSKKKTISVKEIRNAVQFSMTSNFASLVIKYAEEAVEKFSNFDANYISRQDKAGIVFPPSICEKFLRNFDFSKIMLTRTSPVYFASVLEFIVSNILVDAIKVASENNHVRLTIRDLELAVRKNKELCYIFDNFKISFIGGGVLPNIHESLLNKKPRKKQFQIQKIKKFTDLDLVQYVLEK